MGIELTDIRYAYDGRLVLDGVSLHVPDGRFGVILGRNGAGKSTLLRIAAGLLAPQQGEVRIAGRPLAGLDARGRARRVGYLSQFHQPMFSFSVRDVVLTGRAASVADVPSELDATAAAEAMAALGISELVSRPYDELSGGERQLVMIARVLAQQPKALMLDEPVSHLDLANQHRLLRALHGLTRQGITILAVLHDPNHAFLFADEIVYLDRGQIERRTAETVSADAAQVERLYGIPVAAVEVNGLTAVVPFPPERETT
jgi:iron complex transport system ATP-binding protein